MAGSPQNDSPELVAAATDDSSELVPPDADEAADLAGAFAQIVEPLAREQRIAEVEKARIAAESHKVTVEAQERWLATVLSNNLTRFKWLAAIGTLFGLIVCGFAGALLMNGDTTAGLMVISHAVTLVVGLLGGRGLVNRMQRTQQPDQDT